MHLRSGGLIRSASSRSPPRPHMCVGDCSRLHVASLLTGRPHRSLTALPGPAHTHTPPPVPVPHRQADIRPSPRCGCARLRRASRPGRNPKSGRAAAERDRPAGGAHATPAAPPYPRRSYKNPEDPHALPLHIHQPATATASRPWPRHRA